MMRNIKFQSMLLISLAVLIPIYGMLVDKHQSCSCAINPISITTYVFNPNAGEELVIYTHESFMAWGNPADYAMVMNQTFYNFGLIHDVTITVNIFSGMVEVLNLLISQKNLPQADIVIGLDNTMVGRAKEEGILRPLTSGVDLENISIDLISALDSEKYLLPIDFGLIALIFDTEFITTSGYPELTNLNFTSLLSSFGDDLVVQDPTQSATGVNFLLYQLVFYEEILGIDWQTWWDDAKGLVSIDKSWTDSWNRVFDAKEDHMLVSYGTDPAYNAYFNYSFEQNAALIHYNQQEYGWLQIEGIGIIEGTSNEALAKTYINYALSSEVQDYIATNNWMFPANNQTILPPCYDYAITTENVTILNNLISSSYLNDNYQAWLNEWEQLIYGSGLWWAWVLISGVVIVISGLIVYFVAKSRTKLDIE